MNNGVKHEVVVEELRTEYGRISYRATCSCGFKSIRTAAEGDAVRTASNHITNKTGKRKPKVTS